MENTKRGTAELTLDGSPLLLRYGFNRICDLEQRCGGAPLAYLMNSGGRGVAMSFIREAIYCGIMVGDKPTVSVKQIGRMLDKEMDANEGAMRHILIAIYKSIMSGSGRPQGDIDRMIEMINESADEEAAERKATGASVDPLRTIGVVEQTGTEADMIGTN